MKLNKFSGMYLFFALLLCNVFYAQLNPQYTQYMYNMQSVNPAFVGSDEKISFTGLYRTQWLGIEGAPKTANINISGPVSNGLGMGLSLVDDQIGPTTTDIVSVDFSYHIPVSDQYTLYFGLKATGEYLNVDFSKLSEYDTGGASATYNIDKRFSPNVGVGLYLRSDKFYAGVSTPYMLKTTHYGAGVSTLDNNNLNLYVISGYIMDLSDSVQFKPTALLKKTTDAPFDLQLSANFTFNEKFTVGAGYRTSKAVSALAGFQVSNGLYIGYAYDYGLNALQGVGYGTHELFLRFDLLESRKVYNKRFF